MHIGILFGGRSGEHDVSLESARNIFRILDRSKFHIHPIGISRSGRLVSAKETLAMLPDLNWKEILNGRNPVEPTCLLASFSPTENGWKTGGKKKLDVVFPILHGPYGEDGTIQGLLEIADIAYVGTGVLGSALGMDKWYARQLLKIAGLPTVESILIERQDWFSSSQAMVRRIEKTIGLPCFVKPVQLGSSIGVSKITLPDGSLKSALDLASQYDRRILVEKAINARELEVSVLGNTHPVASVVGEIIPGGDFYDYQSKYFDNRTRAVIPADLPARLFAQARKMAVKAFQVLDCRGLARVDFFLERGTDNLFINELNTMPGFTSASMYGKLWEASGITTRELVDRLIELALEWKKLSKRQIHK